MAVQSIMIGALKTALKKAATKVAEETAKEALKGGTASAIKQATAKALKDIGTKAMTDAEAVILNRLKSAPTKALYDFASNQLNLPVSEVRKIVKTFNQTSRMKDLAQGANFREVARQKLRNELKLKGTDKITDIVRKAQEYNMEHRKILGGGDNYNPSNVYVHALLGQIEKELTLKVHGMRGARNQFDQKLQFDLNVRKYFDRKKDYDEDNITLLEKIILNLNLDLERYQVDSGDDLILVEEDGKWEKYDAQSVKDFIKGIKEDVRIALK